MDNIVEKLTTYRTELEMKKNELLMADINPLVEQKVMEYREKVIAELQAEKEANINKIDSDIACLSVIIEREQQKEAEQAVFVVSQEVSVE